MRKLAFLLLLLIVVIPAALIIGAPLIPVEKFRGQIEAAATKALGRQVVLDGPMRAQLIPRIAVTVKNVSIANEPGFRTPLLASAESVDFAVGWRGLLGGNVHVHGLDVEGAAIALERKDNGRANWELSGFQAVNDATGDNASSGSPSPDNVGGLSLNELTVERIAFRDSRFIFWDAGSEVVRLSNADIELRAPSLNKPVNIQGVGQLNGTALAIDGKVGPLKALIDGESANADLTLDYGGLVAGFDGVVNAQNSSMRGRLDAPSVKMASLMSYMPNDIVRPYQALIKSAVLSFDGDVDATPERFAIDDANLALKADGVDARYKGRVLASASNGLENANGTVNLLSLSVDDLAPTLGQSPLAEYLPMLGGINAKFDGRITAEPNQIAVDTSNLKVSANDFDATYAGTLSLFDNDLAAVGDLGVTSNQIVSLLKRVDATSATGLSDAALVKLLAGEAVLRSDLSIVGDQINLEQLNTTFNGEHLSLNANGSVGYEARTPLAFLDVQAQAPNLVPIISALQNDINLPVELQTLDGSFTSNGYLALVGQQLDLENFSVNHAGSLGRLGYTGKVSVAGDVTQGIGQVNLDLPSTANALRLYDPALSQQVAQIDGATNVAGGLSFSAHSSEQLFQLSNLDANYTAQALRAHYVGDVNLLPQGVSANGSINAVTGSLQTVFAPFVDSMPSGLPLGAAQIKGGTQYANKQIALSDGIVVLDDQQLSLNLNADFKGAVPKISAGIASKSLDLNPFLGDFAQPESAGTSSNSSNSSSSSAWSTKQLDLSALDSVQLDVLARVDTLKASDLTFGPTELRLINSGRALNAKVPYSSLFGGNIDADITVDRNASTPRYALTAAGAGLDINALLKRFMKFDRIESNGDAAVSLQAAGFSEADIVNTLSGSFEAAAKNGKIRGVDLVSSLQKMTRGIINPDVGLDRVTPFADLSTRWLITNGNAQVDHLAYTSPALRLGGTGQIGLANRDVDLGLNSTVALFEGAGAQITGDSLELPFRLRGPWTNPQFILDTEALLKVALADPERFLRLLPKGLRDDWLPDDRNLTDVLNREQNRVQQQIQEETARVQRKIAEERARVEAKAQEELQRVQLKAAEEARELEAKAQRELQRLSNQANQQSQEVVGKIANEVQELLPGQLGNAAAQIIQQQGQQLGTVDLGQVIGQQPLTNALNGLATQSLQQLPGEITGQIIQGLEQGGGQAINNALGGALGGAVGDALGGDLGGALGGVLDQLGNAQTGQPIGQGQLQQGAEQLLRGIFGN